MALRAFFSFKRRNAVPRARAPCHVVIGGLVRQIARGRKQKEV